MVEVVELTDDALLCRICKRLRKTAISVLGGYLLAEFTQLTLFPSGYPNWKTPSWEQRKLGDVATRHDNLRIPIAAKDRIPGDTPYYGANGIQGYVEGYTHEGEFVLVAEDGATDLDNYPVQLISGLSWVNNHAHVIKAIPDVAQNRFIMHLIKSMDIASYLVGGTRAKLNAEVLMEIEIKLPSISEQIHIGAILSTLDSLITLHQRKYDKLCTVKKSMLDKMFPKPGETEPEIRFEGFTDPWEQRKFLDVVDVCSGKDYKHLKEGSIPVYGTGGFMTNVDEALSYDRDAVGIGRKGTIDKPYLLKAPFWTVDTLFYAIPKSNIDLEFAHCSFLNVDWKSKDESTGLPSLSKEAINETIALVPSFNEQSQLGEFFNNLDSLITLHQ